MEWNMLKESKKLFPHWLDKSKNSNFSKHLSILNRQQLDMRHELKCLEWSRLIDKPLKIHKVQTEPYKSKIEFEVNVPRLKKVNIYKNPTIIDNEVVNSLDVIDGYYNNNNFYETHRSILTDKKTNDNSDNTFVEENLKLKDQYDVLISGEEGKFYHDLISDGYYKYEHEEFVVIDKENIPKTSLIHSESFIDNYSKFFRHVVYEDIEKEILIKTYMVDENNNQKYKTFYDYDDEENNGKNELVISSEEEVPILYYNVNSGKYCVYEDDEFVELEDNEIVKLLYNSTSHEYYYLNANEEEVVVNINSNNSDKYYIFTEKGDNTTSRIPLIDVNDITPLISNDVYVLEVFTWNDYHFLKGFPEIDFIDYNGNKIIENDERDYDKLSINVETISDNEYLTFRVHQNNIKLVEIFKDGKPIHTVDFLIEGLSVETPINNNFAYIFNYEDSDIIYPFEKDNKYVEKINLDVDEYVWRYKIEEEDKIYNENHNFELKYDFHMKVTYFDSDFPFDSDHDKILIRKYVGEDSIFYHDTSLDMIGTLFGVPRHIFAQPTSFDSYNDELEFYSKTYPTYSNRLSEDDYHYQQRLAYYINNYDRIYFPCLELWKYLHIDSELINRMVIVAEQNYSYMRNLNTNDDKYINELSENKIGSYSKDGNKSLGVISQEGYYSSSNIISVIDNLEKEIESVEVTIPKSKSISSMEEYLNSKNGILVDSNLNYIKDVNGTPVRIEYDYYINNDGDYVIKYEQTNKLLEWYLSEKNNSIYQIRLTNWLKVVPNTHYRLRFCVKTYPTKDLKLKLVYKNNKGDIREVLESTLPKEDYDDSGVFNELEYNHYDDDWGVTCEYISTEFKTLSNAQNVEIYLVSEENFKISDITLQKITINHFDSEYMKTTTDYNSCVYDLYADYNDIPTNIKYDDLTIFGKILNRSLPITKKGFFNFLLKNTDVSDNMDLTDNVNIYYSENMLSLESHIVDAPDYGVGTYNEDTERYEQKYNFRTYVKSGNYEIQIKAYDLTETNIVSDFNVDIKMLVYNGDNTASYETLTISSDELMNEENGYKQYDNGIYFKIPFENKSDNSFELTFYSEKRFDFKDFKLFKKSPMSNEELYR